MLALLIVGQLKTLYVSQIKVIWNKTEEGALTTSERCAMPFLAILVSSILKSFSNRRSFVYNILCILMFVLTCFWCIKIFSCTPWNKLFDLPWKSLSLLSLISKQLLDKELNQGHGSRIKSGKIQKLIYFETNRKTRPFFSLHNITSLSKNMQKFKTTVPWGQQSWLSITKMSYFFINILRTQLGTSLS